jgi:hypothetical protein
VKTAALFGEDAADRYNLVHTPGEVHGTAVAAGENNYRAVVDSVRDFPGQVCVIRI